MAPRPEFSLMERYNGIAQSIVSPTTVMNNPREPKSPTHPRAGRDQRWRPPPSNLPTLKTKVQSGSRRRPLTELGKLTDSSSPTAVGGRSIGGGKKALSATQWILGDHFNITCANQHVDDLSGSSSNQNSTLPKKNFNMCFDHTATVAGDFAATAAEVYRVECKTSDSHAEAGKYGFKAKEARNNMKRTRIMKDHDKKSHSVSEDNSLAEARHHPDDEFKGRDRDSELMRKSSHSRLDRDPSGSPARNNTSDPWLDISPPTVDRTSDVNEFDPQANTLMEAQLEMIQFGQDNPTDSGAKLARAQHDMKLQHKVMDGWKRQLEMTQQRLDDTFAELAQVKKVAQEKHYKATESRAQAVQDRKKLQDMYDKEFKRKRLLEENITTIQQEVSELKISLRNSRSSSPRSAPDQSNKQIIALKAEIVELRLRLAQAHAASFDDLTSTKSIHEVTELKRRLQETEEQLTECRQKDMDLERIKQDHEKHVASLNEKIEQIQSEAQKRHATLEEGLMAAVQEENKVRSELTKCKSNMHRLERERSRNRLHNSADVERLTKQLASAKEEISKMQEEMKEEQKQAKEESNKLKSELACIKENFVQVTKGLARKTTSSMAEKVKLEKQVETLTKELETLKKVLESKEATIANQVKQLSELEVPFQVRGTEPPDASDILQQTIDLQAELKSLQEENTELRSKISQARSTTEQGKTHDSKLSAETEDLIATLRKEVVALGGKVEFLQSTTRSQEDMVLEAKRTEEALKNEVASLKSRLNESETRCTEERLRAEEERRISRENETRHHQELDELKKENEKVTGDKMKLREELEELRKQLAQAGKSMSISVNNGSSDTPSKVNKLRNELALARARLAAAREQTGTVTINSSLSFEKLEDTGSLSLSVCTPEYSVQSASGSIGSTWAPPVISADDSEGTSPTNTMRHESSGKARRASSPRSTVSLGQKSLFDEDDTDVFSEKGSLPESNEKKVGTSGSTRITRNIEELRRQLEESSKRLEKASNRLNGLVDQTAMKKVDVSVPTYQSYHRETISIMTEEESQSGMTEEVVTSEDGDIEVQCVRFADI